MNENKSDNNHISEESFKCYYCPLEFKNKEDYMIHSSKEHSREIWQPSKDMINKIRMEFGYNIEPKGNPWE